MIPGRICLRPRTASLVEYCFDYSHSHQTVSQSRGISFDMFTFRKNCSIQPAFDENLLRCFSWLRLRKPDESMLVVKEILNSCRLVRPSMPALEMTWFEVKSSLVRLVNLLSPASVMLGGFLRVRSVKAERWDKEVSVKGDSLAIERDVRLTNSEMEASVTFGCRCNLSFEICVRTRTDTSLISGQSVRERVWREVKRTNAASEIREALI